MKITIEKYGGSVIVSGDYPDIKAAVEDCAKNNISLERANLRDADLSGAMLAGTDLRGAIFSRGNLSRANLRGAYFSDACFYCADLAGADIFRAYLLGADLEGANLSFANLKGANLSRANLSGANLSGANLEGAYLDGANLEGANLLGVDISGARLYYADLYGANLRGATLPDFQICPQGQAFIAYKKLRHGLVATLEIPADVPRTSSLVGRKCRAQSARIISIEAPDGTLVSEGVSLHDITFIYRTGEVVSEPNYNPDIRVECTQGVHFFMTKEEARKYQH